MLQGEAINPRADRPLLHVNQGQAADRQLLAESVFQRVVIVQKRRCRTNWSVRRQA